MKMFFSRNMSVCSSNTNLPLLLPDHSLPTWLLMAVKYPGITPPELQSQMQCVGDNTAHDCSVRTPWQKDETRLRWAWVWDREEKERWCSSYCRSSGCPVNEWSSWETLRPSLYGNHTPAAVSRTLPLHLCEKGFNQQVLALDPFSSISPLHPSYKPDTLSGCCFTGCGVGNLFSKSKNR